MGRGTQNPFAALTGDLVRVRVETADQSSLLNATGDKNEQVVTLGAGGGVADGTVGLPLSAEYTLDDVLLPVLGRGSVLPANEIGEPLLADRCRRSVIEFVPSI